MRGYEKKRRVVTGLISLSLLVVTTFVIGYALKSQANSNLLGFNIQGEHKFLMNQIPFFEAKAETKQLYPSGIVKNNVVFINLKSDTDTTAWIDADKLLMAEAVLNGKENSLQAYIWDISNQGVKVESEIYTNRGKGYSPSQDRAYYINEVNGKTEAELEEELLREILNQFIEDGSLASKTIAEMDTNKDQFLDNITFVIRGDKDDTHNLLWPHQYALNVGGTMETFPEILLADGKLKVKDYNIILSGDGDEALAGIFNPDNSDIGVIAHEYLHVFGFPDLYHNYTYDAKNDAFVSLPPEKQNGTPLGKWDIMDNTFNAKPQYPLVYTNTAYSPWSSRLPGIRVISESKSKVSLSKVDYQSNEDIAIMIKTDATINGKAEDEYFMIEYRKKERWDSSLPSSGLIVYRINLAANHKSEHDKINKFCSIDPVLGGNHCGNMFGPPDEVYMFRPNAQSPETGNVVNNTDSNLDKAALSKESGVTSLGMSLKEIKEYDPSVFSKTIYYSDGSNSGIVISNVSDTSGDTITFDIELPKVDDDNTAPTIDEPVGNGIHGKWINGTPTISLHIEDKGKGLAEITVTTNDGEIVDEEGNGTSLTKAFSASEHMKQLNFEFKVQKNGTYYVVAKDHDGNMSERKEVHVSNIDNTAPKIYMDAIEKSGNTIKLPLRFEDLESNVNLDTAFYTTLGIKDKTSGLRYDQPIRDHQIILDAGFQGRVCITVKDYAGNSSADESCWTISEDTSPPQVSINVHTQKDEWTADNVVISLVATDNKENDTGIAEIEVTTEDGLIVHTNQLKLNKKYETSNANESFTFEVQRNGNYHIKTCDYAKLCVEDNVTITSIDQSPPVISNINVKNVKSYGLYATSAHEISFQAHDEPYDVNSGLHEIKYQLVGSKESYVSDMNSSKWQSIDVKGTLKTEESFEGIIYAYAVDNVGNHSNIFEQSIERVISNAHILTKSGIYDAKKRINVIGIQDTQVSVALQSIDTNDIKSKLGNDYLASHIVQEVFSVSLLKEGSKYDLQEEVTIRFSIDEALQNNGSLKVIGIHEDGSFEDIVISVGEGYLQFQTNTILTYALVTSRTVNEHANNESSSMVMQAAVPPTGDHTSILVYIWSTFLLASVIGISMKLFTNEKRKH